MHLYTAAVDFDGTLVRPFVDVDRDELEWRPGALALIRGARAAGVRLIVHSCRCAQQRGRAGAPEKEAEAFVASGEPPRWAEVGWRLRGAMVRFLQAQGVWDLVELWEGPGKPLADFYVDDLSEGPDLVKFAAALGVSAPVYDPPHGDGQGITPPVGPGRYEGRADVGAAAG